MPSFSFAQTFAGGVGHSLAVCKDGIVKICGWNLSGQLGDSTLPDTAVPMQINSLSGIISVAAGGSFSFALKNDGTVWAWGRNYGGELGDGTTSTTGCKCKPPVQVIGLSGVIAIDASGHALALKNDGTVWAWGYNLFGELGDSTTVNKSSPVQVKVLTGIIAIEAGASHSLALKNDGTVWAWGRNDNGQLGDGTTIDRWTPVKVDSLTSIMAIDAGANHSLALKNDSTVWVWGANATGQFGNGTNTNSFVPIQVNSGILAISGGNTFSLFIKKDSTVWSCGENTEGELGDGTTTDRWTPVKVNSLTNVIAIAASTHYHCLAMKSDSTLWAWGYGQYGQLGNGIFYPTGCGCMPTPVQVIGGVCPNTAAVNEIEEENNIAVYPNPANENFTIKSSAQISSVEIVNVLGEKVYSTIEPSNHLTIDSSTSLTINLSNQPQRIYFLQINTIEKIYTAKIIIQH
ncbi:MAG: T9SS type A sorting domain-containing protein [Bacteroidetes bacterium]|nr:T9SS type A sorting domain-containing protein [Bacteroidota bacterium]